MEENRNGINISLLITSVNFVFVLCLLAFGYLSMGEVVGDWFKRPAPIAQTSKSSSSSGSSSAKNFDKVVDGIHVQTGLVYAEGFDIVRGTCTACHSAKLVTQNRATREGWKQMITWMQETQGLWDLGKNEPIILDYLATNYAPKEVGRRANIDIAAVEWYILELEE